MSPSTKISAVRALGGVTLASVLLYFCALGLAFHPDYRQTWGVFLSKHVLWMMYLPVMLVLVHLFARVHLGRALLKQGAVDSAIAWTETQQSYNFWLRGKREAMIQRILLARAHIMNTDYEAARAALWHERSPVSDRVKERLELERWRLELALRLDDLVLAKQIIQDEQRPKGVLDRAPAAARSAWHSAIAEWHLRRGEFDASQAHVESARWGVEQAPHADLVQVHRVILSLDTARALRPTSSLDPATALALLERISPQMNHEIPGRTGELLSWRHTLCTHLEREGADDTASALGALSPTQQDQRSRLALDALLPHDSNPERHA